MKKVKNLMWLWSFCLILVWVASVLGAAAPAKPIELIVSSALAPKHVWMASYYDPFFAAMEKETGGRIKFKRYFSAELVPQGKELEALKAGSIEVATPIFSTYNASLFPLADFSMLPTISTTASQAARAYRKVMLSKVLLMQNKTYYDIELERNGIVGWNTTVLGPYCLSTSKKPLRTPADFKGLTVRLGARAQAFNVEVLGGIPITMSGTQLYDALSRGTVAGTMASIADWPSWNLQEVLRYTVEGYSFGFFPAYTAMTKETWAKIPPDIRELWDKKLTQLLDPGAKYLGDQTVVVKKEASEKNKAVFEDFGKLDPSTKDSLIRAAVETWRRWIVAVEAAGYPGKATARLWAQAVSEEGGKLPTGVEEVVK